MAVPATTMNATTNAPRCCRAAAAVCAVTAARRQRCQRWRPPCASRYHAGRKRGSPRRRRRRRRHWLPPSRSRVCPTRASIIVTHRRDGGGGGGGGERGGRYLLATPTPTLVAPVEIARMSDASVDHCHAPPRRRWRRRRRGEDGTSWRSRQRTRGLAGTAAAARDDDVAFSGSMLGTCPSPAHTSCRGKCPLLWIDAWDMSVAGAHVLPGDVSRVASVASLRTRGGGGAPAVEDERDCLRR